MKKKIGDFTLRELKAHCSKSQCGGCEFDQYDESPCVIQNGIPYQLNLDEEIEVNE